MKENKISAIVGPLIRDEDIPLWYQSLDFPVPFFDDKKLPVVFLDNEDPAFFKEADQSLHHFFQLGATDRERISPLVFKNCTDCLENSDDVEDCKQFRNLNNESEVWQFVHPSRIILSRRQYNDKDIYVQIDCECDWEQEHGLQLIFRQGKKLTRVSAFDGHLTEADAFDKPDEEDALLSLF